VKVSLSPREEINGSLTLQVEFLNFPREWIPSARGTTIYPVHLSVISSAREETDPNSLDDRHSARVPGHDGGGGGVHQPDIG
jgi:hypothetical protein